MYYCLDLPPELVVFGITMQRIAILYDASQAVLSTFDLDEVLNQVLAIVRDYFHLQSGSIHAARRRIPKTSDAGAFQ